MRTNATPTVGSLLAEGRFFRHPDGRAVFLRGVNLSGSVKQPMEMPSHQPHNFFEQQQVSFVGRPFPLHEADQHFARLASWGFNFIRFNVTWEAIEHAGPGIYDDAYIAYVCKVLLKAGEYGFRAFIDPHQDVWSRFTGGSGAPSWTLDLAGFDYRNFAAGDAAIVHNTHDDPENYPKMIWATNYYKLAAATMFTLFFAGKTFAPKLLVDGVSIQDYLQEHYFNSISRLAKAIVQTPGLANYVVLGYDTLNEPGSGFIGCTNLSQIMPSQELRHGLTPAPFQTFLLGEGKEVEGIEVWDLTSFGPQKISVKSVNPRGKRAWKNNRKCIWEEHGVWSSDTDDLLISDYFTTNPDTGVKVDFLVDFWKPFINNFTLAIRNVHKNAMIFVEPPVNALPPVFTNKDAKGPLVFAPHWYDGLTLLNKSFNQWFSVDYIGYIRGQYSSIAFALKFGIPGIKSAFKSQLNILRMEGQTNMGNYPCVFGEIGIPFDMDGKKAYVTGDYTSQIKAMDANMSALERNLLNFTLWTYCSDNCNKWGDQWNGEDLSLWCGKPYQDTKSKPDFDNISPDTNILPTLSEEPFIKLSPRLTNEKVLAVSERELIQFSPKLSLSEKPSIESSLPCNLFTSEIIPAEGKTLGLTIEVTSSLMVDSVADRNNAIGSARDENFMVMKEGDLMDKPISTADPFSTLVSDETLYLPIPADLNRGARALDAFVRPYPLFVPGEPLWIDFEMATKTFEVKFVQNDYSGNNIFEAFIPRIHFTSKNTEVWVSDGKYEWDEDIQRLYWEPGHQQHGENLHSGRKVGPRTSYHHLRLVVRDDVLNVSASGEEEDVKNCPSCGLM